MADFRDLVNAQADTNEQIRYAQDTDTAQALVYTELAVAFAIRELGIRLEIAIREASNAS